MKTPTTSIVKTLLLLICIITIAGCRKEDENTATTDDAADAIASALQSTSGGAAQDISSTAEYAMTEGYGKNGGASGVSSLQCGVPFDTTVAYSRTGTYSASYTHSWTVLLSCNGIVPSSLAFTGTYQGNYDIPILSGSASGSRNFVLTGLNPTAQQYTFNGSTTRSGSHTSKVRDNYTYDVAINSNLTNVTVNKNTYRITGGAGTVTATLDVSNGTTKTFNGDIVFNSNNTATLTINGNQYTINLY